MIAKPKQTDNPLNISVIFCKYCKSPSVIKFGKYKGIQRYYCKSCRRKFKNDNYAFFKQVSNDCISLALKLYYENFSINDIKNIINTECKHLFSKSTIYRWINTLSFAAIKMFENYYPYVGITWIVRESEIQINHRRKIWIYDIIDWKTRYFLASTVSFSPNIGTAKVSLDEAIRIAGGMPLSLITSKKTTFATLVKESPQSYGKYIEIKPPKYSYEENELTQRFIFTSPDGIQSIRNIKNIQHFKRFLEGWLVQYNFFTPHQSLDGKTPAEKANLIYKTRNWAELLTSIGYKKKSSN